MKRVAAQVRNARTADAEFRCADDLSADEEWEAIHLTDPLDQGPPGVSLDDHPPLCVVCGRDARDVAAALLARITKERR